MTAPIPPLPVTALVGIQQAGERAGWDDCTCWVGHGDCGGCSGYPGITHEPACGWEWNPDCPEHGNPTCDCPMDPHHRWNCPLTPIWAQTIRGLDCNPWKVFRP